MESLVKLNRFRRPKLKYAEWIERVDSRFHTNTRYNCSNRVPNRCKRYVTKYDDHQGESDRCTQDLSIELNETFLVCFGSYLFAQCMHNSTTRLRYFRTSGLHTLLRSSRIWISLKLSWLQTCFWNSSIIFLTFNQEKLFSESEIVLVAQWILAWKHAVS